MIMLQLARSDWWREGSGGSDVAVRIHERTSVLHVEDNAARDLALLERLVGPAQARIRSATPSMIEKRCNVCTHWESSERGLTE